MSSLLAVDLALFERLTGAPLDSNGNPRLGSDGYPVNRNGVASPDKGGGATYTWGLRIPIMKGAQRTMPGLTSKSAAAVRLFDQGFEANAFKRIPVFDENIENRDISSVWPCVTFRYVDFESENGPYFDPFITGYGAAATITNRAGETVDTGTEQQKVRRHPHGENLTYQIRIYSQSGIELKLIETALRRIMPPVGALVIQFADGTTHACDCLLQGYTNLDSMGDELMPGTDAAQPRHFSRAFTYRIEAWEDNTVNAYGAEDIHYRGVIMERLFELTDIQEIIADAQQNVNDIAEGES